MSEKMTFMPTGNPDLEVIEDFQIAGRLAEDASIASTRGMGPLVVFDLNPPSSPGDRESSRASPGGSLHVQWQVSSGEARDVCRDLKQGTAVYIQGSLFRLTRPAQNVATIHDIWLSAERLQCLEKQAVQSQEMELERE